MRPEASAHMRISRAAMNSSSPSSPPLDAGQAALSSGRPAGRGGSRRGRGGSGHGSRSLVGECRRGRRRPGRAARVRRARARGPAHRAWAAGPRLCACSWFPCNSPSIKGNVMHVESPSTRLVQGGPPRDDPVSSLFATDATESGGGPPALRLCYRQTARFRVPCVSGHPGRAAAVRGLAARAIAARPAPGQGRSGLSGGTWSPVPVVTGISVASAPDHGGWPCGEPQMTYMAPDVLAAKSRN